MTTHFDDKGKIFTQVVSKKPVPVILRTAQNTLQGILHVRPTERIIDELNSSLQFVAITDARILNEAGGTLYTTGFITVNKEHIIWVIPEEEIQDQAGQDQ